MARFGRTLYIGNTVPKATSTLPINMKGCQPNVTCCQMLPQGGATVELYTNISLVSITVGCVLILVGFVVPREYKFDRTKPARQMEAIELAYSELSDRLDLVMFSGLVFVACGLVIMTATTTAAILRQLRECEVEEPLLEALQGDVFKKYGTTRE